MLDPVRAFGRRLLHRGRAGATADSLAPLLSDSTLVALAERVKRERHALAARRETRYRHAGDHRSAHLGRGLDYEEARPYQPGDDVRTMDWRTTARTGKPYLKVYREDHQPALHLVIDRGPGMRFGTRKQLKAAQAARIAAVLAFDAAASHATVGATLWQPGAALVSDRSGMGACLDLLKAAAAPCPPLDPSFAQRQWSFADMARRLSAAVRADARVVLISDFRQLDAADLPVLARLASRYELHAVRVLDAAELSLPDIGTARFRDSTTGAVSWLDTTEPAVREHYRRWSAAQRAQQQDWFGQAGVRLHACTTETDPFDLLRRIHGHE